MSRIAKTGRFLAMDQPVRFATWVLENAAEAQVMIGDSVYCRGDIKLPPGEPLPEHMSASTLDAIPRIIEYEMTRDTIENQDDLLLEVHPTSVGVYGALEGRHRLRPCYLVCSAGEPYHPFGVSMDLEAFNVWMRTGFAQSEQRDALVTILSNVTQDDRLEIRDTGATQQVTVTDGVAGAQLADIPKVMKLAPFRTFAELEQPESEFIVRIKKGQHGPTVALHEPCGARWELAALASIREYVVNLFVENPSFPAPPVIMS
ncbi:MAG: hypothetical protein GY715_14195 [Planctomycetes bacterium]|nr:hypothetical protein [Planctomycetota bacterium]